MANAKISALTALAGANVDTAADVMPIIDTSTTTTKKITVDELGLALQPFVDSDPLIRGSADSTKLVRLEVDGLTTATTRVITVPDRDLTLNNLSPITASLGSDVSLNDTINYIDGPAIAQGTTGTWFVSGTVTLFDASAVNYSIKLWDGTTVIASTRAAGVGAGVTAIVSLSGYIASPAGNLKISVKDEGSSGGLILYNNSGNLKDSTITAIRVG